MMLLRSLLPLLLLLLPCSVSARQEDPVCIRQLQNSQGTIKVCVAVDDDTASKLTPKSPGVKLKLRRLLRENPCRPFPLVTDARNYTVVVLSSYCSLAKMMRNARLAGFSSLMVIANLSVYPLRLDIGSDPQQIPVIVIAANLYRRLLSNTSQSFPKVSLLPSMESGRGTVPVLVFPLITFFCLAVGMWFSVHGKFDVFPNFIVGGPRPRGGYRFQRRVSPNQFLTENNSYSDSPSPAEKNCPTWSNAVCIVFFVAFSAGWLLLLYFFYDIFVWVMIVLICLLFTSAFKSLIMEGVVRVFRASNESCTLRIKNTCLRHLIGESLDKRSVAIFPLCAVPAILWIVYRKTMYVYLLQDICGVVACIHVIKTVRFGSLKALTFLGALFFFYDIIMVYITPFFMPRAPDPAASTLANPLYVNTSVHRVRRSADRGMSVMEAVATGQAGSSGEKLPILFGLPSINFDGSYSYSLSRSTQAPCYFPTVALLGFGDIIVPGMLLAYAYYCDYRLKSAQRRLPWLYSAAGLVGYQVGLGLVYVLLYVMRSGQPALLMLIPCTVLPFVAIAAVRRELPRVWTGVPQDDEPPMEPQPAEGGDMGQDESAMSDSAQVLETSARP